MHLLDLSHQQRYHEELFSHAGDAQMMQARLFEFGVIVLAVLAIVLAVAIGNLTSMWFGFLLLLLLVVGLLKLIYNYDYWLVRRIRLGDDTFMLNLFESGFVSRTRWLVRNIPSNPRCRFCMIPFGGVGKLIGIKHSTKNPNICRSCFEALPTMSYECQTGVLFADIRGFTSWAETRPPVEAAESLTRFYTIVSQALTSDDVLVELVGDQVMALYVDMMPSLGEGRAPGVMLAAARRLVDAIRTEDDALPVGVGLNFGSCEVGNIAKGESKDFTAVGDVVNTAARLQTSAEEYEIVLSEAVYAVVADDAPEAKQVSFDLKGKAGSVQAFVIPAPA